MRLQSNNQSLNKSRSRSEHNLVDLKSDNVSKNICVPMMSEDRQSSTSEVSNYSSLSSSVSASSAVSASLSSFGYGSLKETAVASNASANRSPTPVSKPVPRFGEGCSENCLFPLSLTVNATEFLKGRSTWSSILIAAEEALHVWEDAAKYRKKNVNRVLDEVSFISPMSALESETLLLPNCKLPLRRYCSDIDLRKFRKDRKVKQSNLSRRRSLLELDEIVPTEDRLKCLNGERDEDNQAIDKDDECNEPNAIPMRRMSSRSNVEIRKAASETLRRHSLSPKKKAKSLISTIKLDNPISVGIQLTNIDKDLFTQLSPAEVFKVVICKQKSLTNHEVKGIETLIAFREEVKRMVINVVTKERTVELQSRKIAAFIEVACVLRKLRNWNSLDCIIKALQSPHIYVLERSWSHTATSFPIHFGDYLKLTKFVRSCDQHLIRTTESQPSIPSLTSLINNLKVQCLSKYDLIVCERRWTECDNLIVWLESELRDYFPKRRRSSGRSKSVAVTLHPNRFSLLPYNDTIRFVSLNSLPFSTMKRELRSVSSTHFRDLYSFFVSCFTEEVNFVKCYSLIKHPVNKS